MNPKAHNVLRPDRSHPVTEGPTFEAWHDPAQEAKIAEGQIDFDGVTSSIGAEWNQALPKRLHFGGERIAPRFADLTQRQHATARNHCKSFFRYHAGESGFQHLLLERITVAGI